MPFLKVQEINLRESIASMYIVNPFYAHDIVLIAPSADNLEWCAKWGMSINLSINLSKTNIVHFWKKIYGPNLNPGLLQVTCAFNRMALYGACHLFMRLIFSCLCSSLPNQIEFVMICRQFLEVCWLLTQTFEVELNWSTYIHWNNNALRQVSILVLLLVLESGHTSLLAYS